MPSYSGVWNLVAQYQAVGAGTWPPNYVAPLALFAGGFVYGGNTNAIDYVNITTTGNATSWGSLSTTQAWNVAGCGSSTRGLFASSVFSSNTVQYITYSSAGDSVNFGDLFFAAVAGALSNSTRGVFAGGGSYDNHMDYCEIATTGNCSDFGNLTSWGFGVCGTASSTRGIFNGVGVTDSSGTSTNVINYITIASIGNAIDFGDLTIRRYQSAACSSGTRALCANGYSTQDGLNQNVVDYITIASAGNATDFGDLTLSSTGLAGTSSSTIGLFAGGTDSSGSSGGFYNTISYVTIATAGNATDFGDLTVGRYALGACSAVHGGLA